MKTLLTQINKVMMLTLVLGAASLYAQKAESPDFSFDLGAKINDMTITQSGTVVVATNDGLVGIKPGSNELLFNFTDYGKVKPEELNYIPLSPYVMVGQTGFANLSSKKAVIDHVSGKVLFTTESKNWKNVFTCDVMMPQNKLVVSGFQKGGGKAENVTPKVAVYDLGTGEEDYSFFLLTPGKVTMKHYAVTGKPLLLKDKLLIPTSQGIIAKSKTGETLWENKVKNVNWMTSNETETDIYAFAATTNGKNTRIYKINANGTEAWEDERKVKGSVSNFQILSQGLAVVSDVAGGSGALAAKSESKITMFNAANGEDLWDKAPKTKGYVQHFYIMEDGILFGIQSGGINKISYDGNTLFKKPLKTGENILTMAETPQGLIYITSEDANIVNLNSGEQVWAKPLKFKRATTVSSTFDEKNNRYLIAADEKLFSIDADSGASELLVEADFEGKEDPTHIEVRDGGILLTSDQNMMLLDWEGKTNWHEYHRAPGISAFGAILAGVTAVASTGMAMSAAARAGANKNYLGQYNQYGAEMKRAQDMFSAIGTASFNELAKRFKATSATENSQFILTKLDDGVGLIKINKDSGNVEKEIILKDKKPEYKVDEFGGYLYYKPNDKTIYAYNLSQ
ncbi:outer membrane protein assembly factor BamB family protein [Winogradskyella pulchriflava]|uniref:PQQ-binding-like beta-propeller repeat protein n=1 Tax=Winogradskyella pulchriflava TaxID=1110688 RepID=A0ABV6QF76_9FLAO